MAQIVFSAEEQQRLRTTYPELAIHPGSEPLSPTELEQLFKLFLMEKGNGQAEKAWIALFPVEATRDYPALNSGKVYLALRQQEDQRQNMAEIRQAFSTLQSMTKSLSRQVAEDRQSLQRRFPPTWRNETVIRQSFADLQMIGAGLEALGKTSELWARNLQLKKLRSAVFGVRRLETQYRIWRDRPLFGCLPQTPRNWIRLWTTLGDYRLQVNALNS